MRLQYVDRSCILISNYCNYINKPIYFVALIIALTTCGSHALGFEPNFVADTDFPCGVENIDVEGMRDMRSNEPQVRLDVGSELRKMAASADDKEEKMDVDENVENEHPDENGNMGDDIRPSGQRYSSEGTIPNDQSPLFRVPSYYSGTPVQAVKSTTALSVASVDISTSGINLTARPFPVITTETYDPKNPPTLPRKPKICPPRCLTGRGSSVYNTVATIRGRHGDTTYDSCVTKFSWQPTSRVPEAELYRIANEQRVTNIARVIASDTLAMLSDEDSTRTRLVKSCFAKQLDPAFDNRVLTAITISPRCIPLAQVGDFGSFVSALVSLITGQWFGFIYSEDIC